MNVLGVISAALFALVFGAIWYSPFLFGNVWMRAIGETKYSLGSQTIPMIGSVFAAVMTALGVGLLHDMAAIEGVKESFYLGMTLGVLIIFPAFLSDNLFCRWGGPLLFIQSGYRMVAVLFMSLIIGL